MDWTSFLPLACDTKVTCQCPAADGPAVQKRISNIELPFDADLVFDPPEYGFFFRERSAILAERNPRQLR
jgi:hypothetical protein